MKGGGWGGYPRYLGEPSWPQVAFGRAEALVNPGLVHFFWIWGRSWLRGPEPPVACYVPFRQLTSEPVDDLKEDPKAEQETPHQKRDFHRFVQPDNRFVGLLPLRIVICLRTLPRFVAHVFPSLQADVLLVNKFLVPRMAHNSCIHELGFVKCLYL